MSEITDFDSLRDALAENAARPEGPARNARAEQLLAAAERLEIPLAVIEALGHQLTVYNYSSEKAKMFVPFARLLRMWDERPEDFDEQEAHSLHWVFKWMTTGMLDQPHIPLASIEKWLGEMERRYRLAGHSERAVRSAEFHVAAHVGDVPRAERAYAAWLAAARDSMADCHACELDGQGWWQAERGRDEEALRVWRPVLEGEFSCAHEPHAVLASSLLPLVRLGRPDEARAHHLRGFRLVRSMESMRSAYAEHVEFCALTGNEARALELLAERPAYFTDSGQPRSRMEFLSVVALLMDRLTGLGLGARQVPGPAGRDWTARELAVHARVEALALAARFDERNGTAYVTECVRRRMDQPGLLDRLPLGVRSPRSAHTAHATAPAPVAPPLAVPGANGPDGPDGTDGTDGAKDAGSGGRPGLDALLAEARRLSDALQPNAVEAWAAVGRAAEATGGAGLDARARAELADHQAMGLGPDGATLFEHAAELYAEAGDPGEALAARARAAYVRALAGSVDEAEAAVAEPYDRVLALFAEERTGIRQTASVLMARARILMQRVYGVDEPLCSDEEGAAEAVAEGEEGEGAEGAEGTEAEALGLAGPGAAGEGPSPVTEGAAARGLAPSDAEGATADSDELRVAADPAAQAGEPCPVEGSTAQNLEPLAAEGAAARAEEPLAAEGSTGRSQEAFAGEGGTTLSQEPLAAARAEGPFPAEGASRAGGSGTAGPEGPFSVVGAIRAVHPVLAPAETAVREVLALVDGHSGGDVQLASRAAEARAMLAELAVRAGDARTAAALLARAAGEYVDAGLPWFAVEYEARLAVLAHRLGDGAEAARALRAALAHGGTELEPVGRAQLHLQLAEVLGGAGQAEEAAEHALEAAHWADEAGEGRTLGPWARQVLGGFLLRQGRWAEAAEVLESALADLTEATHGDGAVVQAQWWLADCLSELGEHQAAAERRLQAAEVARQWPDQHDHATLAHLAAESLGHAGMPAEADQAYTRAGDLWRSLGNVHGLVRSVRARAWLALRAQDGSDRARELMADALRECAAALDAAPDEEARQRLAAELGDTHRQFGDLLARSCAEDAEDGSIQAVFEAALAQMTEAVAVFAALGEDGLHSRTGAELAAGWLEADLGRSAEAAAHARGVLAAYAGAGERDETTRARRAEAEQMLRVVREQGER
ncbi:tetratricopeptide repeat protein [Streptomyces sp.]|uniref:tetratricopeptide repeat protein n=1 Tax=Streptomyces sp. TaxID=1931 RepID=UPI002D66787C|nr:tetratricopeptide repeat protein [Streptomyces sp.]HZF90092.1 tetratricopeptide repeat protein [Streptomyces sp.]